MITYFIYSFSDNGLADWMCFNCEKVVANEDVHVELDFKYCPYCGAKRTTKNNYKKLFEEEIKIQESIEKDYSIFYKVNTNKTILEIKESLSKNERKECGHFLIQCLKAFEYLGYETLDDVFDINNRIDILSAKGMGPKRFMLFVNWCLEKGYLC